MPDVVPNPDVQPPARRLDRKLNNIAEGRYVPDDFIIADAKDADMSMGVTSGGPINPASSAKVGPGIYRTRADYLDAMTALIRQDIVDIMLMSASNAERVAKDASLAANENITLAVRANDTSDIWNLRGGSYMSEPSKPFRTADLASVREFCDLVLYSMTFNNNLEHDAATLAAYTQFRGEAAALGMRHFLEVFNPNISTGMTPPQTGAFVNDAIVRALAGVTSAQRPLFLKIAYNGADAMAELATFDPSLVVGILGGAAGTTRDTFELLGHAQANGAKVALFGRKIQRSESQLDLVLLMRSVLRGEMTPSEAVREYHNALDRAGITPQRALEQDLAITDPVLSAE